MQGDTKKAAGPARTTQSIRVRALNVEEMGEGIFEIHIPAVVLNPAAQAMLKDLLPDLQDSLALLLQKQALLFAVL